MGHYPADVTRLCPRQLTETRNANTNATTDTDMPATPRNDASHDSEDEQGGEEEGKVASGRMVSLSCELVYTYIGRGGEIPHRRPRPTHTFLRTRSCLGGGYRDPTAVLVAPTLSIPRAR